MKSKSREPKRKTGSRVKQSGVKEESKNLSAFVGPHAKTHADQKSFIGSMMRVNRRGSRDVDEKYSELKRMLQKNSIVTDYDERHHAAPKSKLFSNLKHSKLASLTQHSNLDKSHNMQSGSKEVLHKLKHLFATRSNEKVKTKLKKSKDKKPHGRSIDEVRPSRGHSTKKSRDPSKASRSSAESKMASKEKADVATKKLKRFYDKLCTVVDAEDTSHDDKIQAISKLFIEYAKLTEKLDEDRPGPWSQSEKVLRQKILSFFTFYSKMNAKAYVYTRKLVSDSLAHVEKLIVKEREALLQYTPQYFSTMESVDLEEAVHMLVDFAHTMVEQNQILSGYIRKNLSKSEVDELMLRKNKPSIVKSLMPQRHTDNDTGHTDSSLSNMEKENDLNQLYDTRSPYRADDEYEVQVDAKIEGSSFDKFDSHFDDFDTSKTPLTNKLGYYGSQEMEQFEDNEYEYSETSKKKPVNPLGTKKSRPTNGPSKDSGMSSKDKKTFPPKSTKDTWPKKSLGSTQKFDDQSFSNLIEETEGHKHRQMPAIDLRLRLGQIKKG